MWLVFGTVALAFAVAAHRRPSLAAAGLVLIDPCALSRYVGPTTLTLPKAAIVGFAAGLLLRRPILSVLRTRRVLPTLLAVIAVLAATALSYFQADFKAPAIRETFKALEYLAVFVLCVLALDADPDDRSFRVACFTIGTVVALLAIGQEFTHGASQLWVIEGRRAMTRIAGPLEGPNQLAGYLALVLPVMAAYLLRDRRSAFGWVCFAVTAAAETLTFSRAGAASAIVALGIVVLVSRFGSQRARWSALAVAVAAAIAAIVLAGGDFARFWSTASQYQPEGLGTRKQLWTAAWRLWQAHPLLGIGAGNYEFELSRAGFPELRTHPNGQYLQALVEGGPPLLAATLGATFAPIWSLWRCGAAQPACAGALGALCGLALHQLLDSMTFFPKVGMMAWILAGVSLALSVRRPQASAAL